MDALYYPHCTTPPSTTKETQQDPRPSHSVLTPVDYIYITTSLQTQDGEQDSVHEVGSSSLHSLPALDVHARTFVPGASEHGLEAVLNVHAVEFVPGALNNSMPSTPGLRQQSGNPYVFEAQQDFDPERLYQQRKRAETAANGPMLVQGFYFPTSSNRDDYVPSVFTAFRNYERFPLVKAEYKEQTPEERESARRSFVQSMHDGDKGIEGNEEEGDPWRMISTPQFDYQWFELAELQSLKCIHHFNVFGRPVLTKSGTAPATTIAILKSTPKHLSVTTPDGLWKSTVMACAQKLLDPVLYHGRKEVLHSLRGSALENAWIGRCKKTYSEHGWWVHDSYGPQEHHVMNDPLNPWLYPNRAEIVMINGISESFGHRVDIITAATREKEREDAARKAAFNARLRQGRNPSRLGLSCSTHEDVKEVPSFTSGPRTTSSSLRHPACRSLRQPTTIVLPVHEPADSSSEVVVGGRHTTGSSLPRDEWKRLLAAAEDRPVAACWADDEDEDWEESNVVPALSSLVAAPGNPQTSNDTTSADQEVEDTENLHDEDDHSVSSTASRTVEHSRAPSVSPGEPPDTSLPVSDHEDGLSEALTNEEGDDVCCGVDGAAGDPRPAFTGAHRTGNLEMELVEPASSVRTHASNIHARLDAIEEAMRTAAAPSASLVPESLAPPHFDSSYIPPPIPRDHGVDTRSKLPVVVLASAEPLPSELRPVVHQFPNGAITMTPSGQQLGLVRSHGVRFDQLPVNFGNAPFQHASVPPTRILSEEHGLAVETEIFSTEAETAAAYEVEDSPSVAAAAPQPQSTALVLYPGPVPLDNSMDRYFGGWNRLLANAGSSSEHFWQCGIRRFGVEASLDALAFDENECDQPSATSARVMANSADHGASVVEAIIGNMVPPDVAPTHNTECNAGVVSVVSPLTTAHEENQLSSAQEAALRPLPASIGLRWHRHDGRRVRFALPPPPAAPMSMASRSQWPDFSGVYRIPSSLPTVVSPSSTTWALTDEASRFSWTSSDDASEAEGREQGEDVVETQAGEEQGEMEEEKEEEDEEEVLHPMPHLPEFQRTRQDWQHASWNSTLRRRLTRRRPPAQEAQVRAQAQATSPQATSAKAKGLLKQSWQKIKAFITRKK
ncbi:hypothetical protein AYL99_08075 [Fonsecaea erecta]|uniref:Uncharacterized protein n=1 Tax=Fonsecaea erecta TaxID=1367422 RepID=A0A178ZC34_9EURO|nr:hypothetical protein AYL99_08075 [Fonsecaea erecta]OAP57337.1 hypothetical protein AYL99_08075 [Fonsecaea erecta]